MKAVFRKFSDGQVIALICNSARDCNPGMVMSYMHIGQHSEASRDLGRNLKLASPEEYASLQCELQGIYGGPVAAVSRLQA